MPATLLLEIEQKQRHRLKRNKPSNRSIQYYNTIAVEVSCHRCFNAVSLQTEGRQRETEIWEHGKATEN